MSKWHFRFLDTAKLVASWSKDPSTKCGAVIVRPDNTIASVGFNGFPRGIADRSELYNNREEKYQRVIHAEVNAVLSAKEPIKGYTLYSWPPCFGPTCDRCSTVVIQAGVSRIVWVRNETDFGSRWREPAMRGIEMYKEAGVELISVSQWAFDNASRE